MKEIWKDIPSFEGYQVSNLGRVRSIDRIVLTKDGRNICYKGKLLKLHPNKQGYLQVLLGTKNMQRVHLIVLKTFIGPRPPMKEGCHKDGNRKNNWRTNLCWGSKSKNAIDRVKHGNQHTAKLNPLIVRHIRSQGHKINKVAMARKYSVNRSTIYNVLNNQSWKHV